ncbi:MAG: hypothetical protein DMG74_08900 [Acidobacteria bacterium]|nr:MAG: hypothetical protein DMG74_08900 [Acidobacteriota bacterium]
MWFHRLPTKNFVSHTVADYTAILKLIETRFKLANLSKRAAAQVDMSEFFDFTNPPWMTPPSSPLQDTTKLCNYPCNKCRNATTTG